MMIQRPERVDVLRKAEIPVLFVMGTEDKTVNLADGLAQSHLPVESHVHILKTSGHMGMKEEPDKTVEAMKGFLLHLNEN
jgi:pimeloyl-ACP methyl ester carboxylesterase